MESPLDIDCSFCGSFPGQRCTDRNGKDYEPPNFHATRTYAYRTAAFRAMQAEARKRDRKRAEVQP